MNMHFFSLWCWIYLAIFYQSLSHYDMVLWCDINLQVDIDFEKEPIGTGKDGKSIFFKDIWPSNEEVAEVGTDPWYLFWHLYLQNNAFGFLYNELFLLLFFSPWHKQLFCCLCSIYLMVCPELLVTIIYTAQKFVSMFYRDCILRSIIQNSN